MLTILPAVIGNDNTEALVAVVDEFVYDAKVE
jgi:hypothetical protein